MNDEARSTEATIFWKRDWVVVLTPNIFNLAIAVLTLGVASLGYYDLRKRADDAKAEIEMRPDLDVTLRLKQTGFSVDSPRQFNGLIKFSNHSLESMKIDEVVLTVFKCNASTTASTQINRQSDYFRMFGLKNYYSNLKSELMEAAKVVTGTKNEIPVKVAWFFGNSELEKSLQFTPGGQYYVTWMGEETVQVSDEGSLTNKSFIETCEARISDLEKQMRELPNETPGAYLCLPGETGDYQLQTLRKVSVTGAFSLPAGEQFDVPFYSVEVAAADGVGEDTFYYQVEIAVRGRESDSPKIVKAGCFTATTEVETSCGPITD